MYKGEYMMNLWKYKIIEYEYKSMTSEKMEVAKQLHKTNSWFLMKLITLCLKLNGIKYDVVIK